MSREKIWAIAIAVALLLLSLIVLLPSGKENSPVLWSEDWSALEFPGNTGVVRMEKAAGWYTDGFLVGEAGHALRPAAPSVKSLFLDLQRPVVKAEYRVSDQEASEIFSDEHCLTLIRGSTRRELCGGRVSGGQAFARLREDPLRVFLVPEYIFSRLRNDPAVWIEKRWVVLPSGSTVDTLHVQFQGESVDLRRKKEKVEQGEKIHWYIGDREVGLNLANNLISALYGLQRDQLVGEPLSGLEPAGEIVISTVTESPSIEGIFRGFFGKRTLKVRLYTSREVDGKIYYPAAAETDGMVDLVSHDRVDKVLAAMKALEAPVATPAPPILPPTSAPVAPPAVPRLLPTPANPR